MKEEVKNILKRIVIVCTLVVSIIAVFVIIDGNPTFADSGFDTSYDSGGSSWDSGSSWDYDYDDDYSYRHSDYDYSGSGEINGGMVVTLLIIAFIIIIYKFVSNQKEADYYMKQRTTTVDDTTIETQIKQYIPDFNKEEFLANGYNIYCKVQDAWMNFKLDSIKNIITDELYTMYESQLATLEVKGEQNIMKDFVLKNSFLKGFEKQNNTVTISTVYIIEFYDYIAEQSTGKVIRGTADKKMRIKYEMKFRQTLDETKKVTKCPNCGADIEMNTSGVCDYCHTKLVTENTKWVLTEKQTLDQEYV